MDFNTPSISGNYATGYTDVIVANQKELGKFLDSSDVTVTNPVANLKRYNAGNQLFEKRNAGNTAWEEMPLAYAKLASPTFTGTPAGPTAAADTNTTQLATTAFVVAQAGSTNPIMNGTVAVGTSLRFSRQDHVHPVDTSRAPLASPNFSGTPQVGGQNIWHAGNLVIANYAPINSPQFTGAPASTNGQIWNYGYTGNANIAVWYGNSTGSQYLYNGNNQWTCTGSWYATDFIISSDEQLKDEIEPIRDPLQIVDAMEGIRFKYRKDGRRSVGFGARRTREVLPELVYERADGSLAMTYGQVTAVHNEAIKELAARLAAVESR